MNIDLAIEVAQALIRRWEGCYLRPYLCPAGVPTIGYGATYYEDGTRVALTDDPISKERAEALLVWMVKTKYLPPVLKLCPGIDNPDRIAAIIDFTFNLGTLEQRILRSPLSVNVSTKESGRKFLKSYGSGCGQGVKS